MTLHYYDMDCIEVFNGYTWSRTTALHWEYPLAAVALYVALIPVLKASIAEPVKIPRFALCWNLGLSLFSLCGLVACAPVLLNELRANGFYFTTCAPAPWYGGGYQGRKRVIQRRFNVSVPRARVSETAPTLRERSER
jgi:hypothetical protein